MNVLKKLLIIGFTVGGATHASAAGFSCYSKSKTSPRLDGEYFLNLNTVGQNNNNIHAIVEVGHLSKPTQPVSYWARVNGYKPEHGQNYNIVLIKNGGSVGSLTIKTQRVLTDEYCGRGLCLPKKQTVANLVISQHNINEIFECKQK